VVVVTGIRASAQSSVAIKRDTMEVVDSITAEDIGKLPDPNVTETMTRIPGVQGYRYGGEGASPVGSGSGVTIRGLSGQTASQVNGRAYFTAGSREFNLEGALPGMVAGIDVYKNPSAEHIEGGIGGLVNIRTRNPSDFKDLTVSLSANARYNDLEKKTDPELFGLVANRFNLSGGGRIGVMAAAVYQKSTGRSDNNPANGGANLKRAIRADSAEYATLAAANTSNLRTQPMSQYVGRSDVHYLASVPMAASPANTPNLSGLSAEQQANVMVAPALTSNAFQETIMRERRGLNLAADWRVDNTLRFYTEANYTYYLYHQHYRGLNSSDGGNVQGLATTPWNYTEGLANRNLGGGSDDVLVGKRLQGGTFLNSTVNNVGGHEHRPYKTWIAATGVEWNPTPALSLKGDFSYLKASQTIDNRAITMQSRAGLLWSTTRLADGEPHQLTFSGPSLTDPANFVYDRYNNGNRVQFNDDGRALALNGAYSLDEGFFLNRIKFGTRFADQKSHFRNYSYSNKFLTTNGLELTGNQSNGIVVNGNNIEMSPTDFMDGKAGYAGGFLVYGPDKLLGDQVRGAFANAGIPADNAIPENVINRRTNKEETKALYLMGEFAALDDRLRGNVGVRVVRTTGSTTGFSNDVTSGTPRLVEQTRSTSYTNTLPSLNLTYDLTKDFLARFGYGRGMTRPDLGALNPSITVNTVNGTGNIGNPELRPFVADSVDLSFERYFSKTNYAALALFNKDIDGFHAGTLECMTVPTAPLYTGTQLNGCTNGQYSIGKTVNAEKGYVRGVEVSGQYFFDASAGWLKNFGVSGSYTHVKTSNPINFGTPAAPRVVDTPQAMQSKNSFSVSGMYEDDKLSARLVYTWRSPSILFNVATNPIDGRYIGSYGILDGSINYELTENLTLSLNASNITDKAPNRYVGEPGGYETGLQRQHYVNGRVFSLGLRYKFGKG
jgi:TonB-dependent receptor